MEDKIKTHKDLNVWKDAMTLALLTYQYTETFPKQETYGLTSQMRRASVSIPSNIAEGAGRGHKKELIQFLNIAKGSIAELETQALLAHALAYLNQGEIEKITNQITLVRKQLISLIKTQINSFSKN